MKKEKKGKLGTLYNEIKSMFLGKKRGAWEMMEIVRKIAIPILSTERKNQGDSDEIVEKN